MVNSNRKYSILGKMLFNLLERANKKKEVGKYTLEDFASAADMEPTELCRYLTGRRKPKLHQVIRLLSVFPSEIAKAEICTEIIHCAGFDISYDYCIENEDYRAIIEMKNRTVVEVNKHLSFYGKEIITILQ